MFDRSQSTCLSSLYSTTDEGSAGNVNTNSCKFLGFLVISKLYVLTIFFSIWFDTINRQKKKHNLVQSNPFITHLVITLDPVYMDW